jgi:hypothetical protein
MEHHACYNHISVQAKENGVSTTDDVVVQKILRQIGKGVSFQYPGTEGRKEGVLKDRAVVPSNPGSADVPYWDVVDLIEFPGEPEPNWIRIGYYRTPGGRLVWGSQTTITEPVGTWKRLLVQAAKAKPWFKDLLCEVMAELQS